MLRRMPGTIGLLLPADERFDHQIVDTTAADSFLSCKRSAEC